MDIHLDKASAVKIAEVVLAKVYGDRVLGAGRLRGVNRYKETI